MNTFLEFHKHVSMCDTVSVWALRSESSTLWLWKILQRILLKVNPPSSLISAHSSLFSLILIPSFYVFSSAIFSWYFHSPLHNPTFSKVIHWERLQSHGITMAVFFSSHAYTQSTDKNLVLRFLSQVSCHYHRKLSRQVHFLSGMSKSKITPDLTVSYEMALALFLKFKSIQKQGSVWFY